MENISNFTKSLRSTCSLANNKVRSCSYKLVILALIFTIFLTLILLYDRTDPNVQTNSTKREQRHQMHAEGNKIKHFPQAIIIGVKKGGTRALLNMLSLHPHIQTAGKEIHFFDRNKNYLKGLEWYRKKMPYSLPGQITIEKTPGYFVTPQVPERVRAMNASVKLLLIVREPVTRAISEYTQHLAKATLPQVQGMKTGDVAPSVQEYRNFEELALFPNGSINESYRPLVISMYDLHMHRWLEVFPREQMLIVNGDQLIDDPLSQLTKIETFLGIQHRIESNNFYFNTTKGFFCLRNETGNKCLKESKGRKHPHVDQAVIRKLRRFFADHNRKFYELIGEDLGWPEE